MQRRVGSVSVSVAVGVPGPPRVGFVVGKDVGSAVRRNRVKRRLREALAQVPLLDGNDYVVVGRAAVAGLPFRRVVEAVRTAVGA